MNDIMNDKKGGKIVKRQVYSAYLLTYITLYCPSFNSVDLRMTHNNTYQVRILLSIFKIGMRNIEWIEWREW